MFFSLLQTLVCVLLVNSGLYALHLTGSNTPGSAGSSSSISSNGAAPHVSSQLNNPSTNTFQATSNRLNEDLADLAQLERERLMVMGLVKQTAEESGYRGRPVITGHIRMHPAQDMDSEYSAWLNQQSHKVMFGNVVKQPHDDEEENYDTGGGGGAAGAAAFDPLRTPHKYDFGRLVQPREREFENPHNLDLDDFMELEPMPEEEDMFPDMDGYAYIEELMAEENKERLQHRYPIQQHQQQMLQFPGLRQHAAQAEQQQQLHQQHHIPLTHSFQHHEPLEASKQDLQDFFEKEQKLQTLNHHQQQQLQQQLQQQQQAKEFNAKYRNNIRLQQKWLRKRTQMQQPLPRNIFGQKYAKQEQQQAKIQHHFNSPPSSKLAMANSEATATTHAINNKQTATATGTGTATEIETAQEIQNQQQQMHSLNDNDKEKQKPSPASASAAIKADESEKSKVLDEKTELLQPPNHKRSGVTPAALASAEGAESPHSLAKQLMLRQVRGQRQYDVPQIECPTAMDGMERFACPTPDLQGRYRCIDDHVLCDGFIDCPEGEDEDRRSCMFYKTTKAHLDVLADALLRWARGR